MLCLLWLRWWLVTAWLVQHRLQQRPLMALLLLPVTALSQQQQPRNLSPVARVVPQSRVCLALMLAVQSRRHRLQQHLQRLCRLRQGCRTHLHCCTPRAVARQQQKQQYRSQSPAALAPLPSKRQSRQVVQQVLRMLFARRLLSQHRLPVRMQPRQMHQQGCQMPGRLLPQLLLRMAVRCKLQMLLAWMLPLVWQPHLQQQQQYSRSWQLWCRKQA